MYSKAILLLLNFPYKVILTFSAQCLVLIQPALECYQELKPDIFSFELTWLLNPRGNWHLGVFPVFYLASNLIDEEQVGYFISI